MAKVLVVEDDPAIRQMLTVALELEGHAVSALCDGSQVVATLACEPERVIVLLDLMMPRVSGWEVCERLTADAALAARHVVVVMSAAIAPGECFPDVVRAALLKPFNLNVALSLVEALSLEPQTTLSELEGAATAQL